MRNRKGAYTVFLMMILSGFMIFLTAILSFMGKMAVNSTTDDFGRLWGKSILAEYDVYLKERYGIFAYYGDQEIVLEKLNDYASFTFDEKEYITYQLEVESLEPYRLVNFENLKEQMVDVMTYQIRPDYLEDTPQQEGTAFGTRKITASWILENLPSANLTDQNININGLVGRIKSGTGLSDLIGTTAINQYIMTFFRHQLTGEEPNDTYFKNEWEYIITGNPDDVKALKNTRRQLILLRNLLNLAHLYGSAEKREASMALANVLTPGPEAVVTQGVLMEAWAYAEAENDVRLLLDGKTVPLRKADEHWALSLDHAVNFEEGADGKGYILPSVCSGESYETYLRMLINLVPEELRLCRVMDLIQINMKYSYCDWFQLKEFYVGLSYSITINGEKHDFKESY